MYNKPKKKQIRIPKEKFKDLENDHNISDMYKLTRNQLGWKKGGGTPNSFLMEGKRISAPAEMANIQLETFNKKLKKLKDGLPRMETEPTAALRLALQNWGIRADARNEFEIKEVTLSQTSALIKKLGNSRTYGNDELDATSIKIAAQHLLIPITHLINQSIRQGSFPNQWKIAKLIPLHKGKGMSQFDPSQYRPISILPVLSKILEKVIQQQMINFLDNTNQLNRNHHLYRSHHSTTTALLQLTNKLYKATDRNLISTLLTIDESAAFECVSHKILIEKMKLYKFLGTFSEMVHKLPVREKSICGNKWKSVQNDGRPVRSPSRVHIGTVNVHFVH